MRRPTNMQTESSEQQTWELETTEGIVFMVLNDGDDIEEQFELYKNDEAGELIKNAKLIQYTRIN
jgi:capsid protein